MAMATAGPAGGHAPAPVRYVLRLPELGSEIDRKSYEVASGWTAGGCASHAGTAERVERMLGHFLPSERFTINVGMFSDTLTRATAQRPAAIVHIDCDLYEFDDPGARPDAGIRRDPGRHGADLRRLQLRARQPEFGERRAMHETFDNHPRFSCEKWFSYGWHGEVRIVHERGLRRSAARSRRATRPSIWTWCSVSAAGGVAARAARVNSAWCSRAPAGSAPSGRSRCARPRRSSRT